jgi:poly(A) polymerase
MERIAVPGWMRESGVCAVLHALQSPEGDARFVGGAVRDTLLKRRVTDLDLATPLHPDAVTRMLSVAGVKTVPTGIAHGTVTAVTGKRAIEITTLRHDVENYGRRALVAFDASWESDARRRDFTMNALYLDAGGRLYDYVGGLADLRAGRVRFVGDPATRIREDALRLLRFYRFLAHYGKTRPDPKARAACRNLASLLPNLSAERIAAELLKLLAARDPLPALRMIREDGVLRVLLPEAGGFARLARLVAREPAPDPLRRLAALLARDAADVGKRLRLSNAQRARLAALAAPAGFDPKGDLRAQRRALYRLGPELYRDRAMLSTASPRTARRLLALASRWRPRKFPLSGGDLASCGVAPGPALGKLLGQLEAWWVAADFKPNRAQCLAELDRRAAHG